MSSHSQLVRKAQSFAATKSTVLRLHFSGKPDMACVVAADVPAQYGKVSFVFQRGGSLQYTDAVYVDTERKAYWNEVLKLVQTFQDVLHKQANL